MEGLDPSVTQAVARRQSRGGHLTSDRTKDASLRPDCAAEKRTQKYPAISSAGPPLFGLRQESRPTHSVLWDGRYL
jgi:hypothetical protein